MEQSQIPPADGRGPNAARFAPSDCFRFAEHHAPRRHELVCQLWLQFYLKRSSLVATFLKSLSDKEFGGKGSGIGVLSETVQLALFVGNHDDKVTAMRETNDIILGHYLGDVRAARIKDFHYSLVFPNVPPPSGVPGWSGMDPNAISDPVAKSNYLKAIDQNNANELANNRQALLQQINAEVSSLIIKHMIMTIQQGVVARKHVVEWMDSARLDDEERKAVNQAMDKSDTK